MKRKACRIFAGMAFALLLTCVPFGALAARALEAPANCRAVCRTDNAAALSWNAVSGAEGYMVYMSSSKNSGYTRIKTTKYTKYTATALKTGVTAYFKVRAYRTVDGARERGALSAAFCCVPRPAVKLHGALSVKDGRLVDKNGKAFQLRGVSTHGLAWFPQYVSVASFKTMRGEWNVNAVRLALYTEGYNGWCVGSEANRERLREVIDTGVSAATKLGMYVVIDWHILSDGDPLKYKAQALAFFREMAERYRENENVLYEICNEPNGGVSWSTVKKYANSVIKTIRAIDDEAVIITGTPTWSQDVDIAAKNPISGYKNIMYALHFYADTHRDALRSKLKTALAKGLPVIVSEFGVCNASGGGSVNKTEANKWIRLLDENGISYFIWNLSNKNETSALIRSNCAKLSGWRDSELTDAGRWFAQMMRG